MATYRDIGGLAMCSVCIKPLKAKWYTWKGKGAAMKPVCQNCRPFTDVVKVEAQA